MGANFVCVGCDWPADTKSEMDAHTAECSYYKVYEERDRFKGALEKILNIRVQDKQIADAWKEARQIAFDAFSSSESR